MIGSLPVQVNIQVKDMFNKIVTEDLFFQEDKTNWQPAFSNREQAEDYERQY